VEDWVPPDVGHANDVYVGLMMADGNASMRRLLRGSRVDRRIRMINLGASYGPIGRRVVSFLSSLMGQPRLAGAARAGGRRSADGYWQLIAERTAYRERFLAALDRGGYDAILCPPYAFPAVLHGRTLDVSPGQSYAALYNLLGMPAGVISVTRVRAGEESDRPKSREIVERVAYASELGSAGLPIGVQVAARHWREDVVLAVMGALEAHFRGRSDYPPALRVPF
jgi:fatty acid amide hydrolase